MKKTLLEILACPMCKKHPLELIEIKTKNDEIVEGAIYCETCERYFLIIEEIPVMSVSYTHLTLPTILLV